MAGQENWLPVVGWEDRYEVSDHGRVRSIDRTVVRNGKAYERPGRVLMPVITGSDGRNRLGVSLYADGKSVRRMIHTLVLEAFVGPRPEGHYGCHTNDIADDNQLENLRWATPSENSHDKVRNGNDHNASKTHCKHGHEFTLENTYITSRGNRDCRECQRRRIREYMSKRRAAAPKDDSLCGQCGEPRDDESRRLCAACRDYRRERSRQDRRRNESSDRCNKCGGLRDSNFLKLCSSCRAYNREMYEKRKRAMKGIPE